jgi:uncharacterized protein (TIGR02145 family)
MDLNGQFYFVKDNKPVGPFSLDELIEKDISNKTYIWTKGMVNWEKVESIPVILERINNNKNQPPVFIEPISEGNNVIQKGKGVNKIILFAFIGIIVLVLGIIGGIYFKDDLLKVTETVKVEDNQVKDIDGNVYEITKIGNQYWTTKNLNVSRFRDGDEIPFVTSKEEWERAGKMGKPACCCYVNLGYNCEKYGRLYNWYAVIDARGLAPEGFHIPSDKEWSSLDDYLGSEAGKILKSTEEWVYNDNSLQGTNDFGFSALPGGWYADSGGFMGIRNDTHFWSSTEYGPLYRENVNNNPLGAYYRYLDNNNSSVSRGNGKVESVGASVRCLRD